MYLAKDKLDRDAAKNRRRLFWTIVMTAFFALSTFWAITDYEGLRSGLSVYAAFLVLGLFLLARAAADRRRLNMASTYAAAFADSRKPELPLQDLAESLGKSGAEAEKELNWLLDKGYLTDCSVLPGPAPRVVLGRFHDPEADFVVEECPHCGANVKVRRGRSGRCEYCGSTVWEKEQECGKR